MEQVRPVFKKLFVAAIVFYVLAVTYMLADIYTMVGKLDHAMMHVTGETNAHSPAACETK